MDIRPPNIPNWVIRWPIVRLMERKSSAGYACLGLLRSAPWLGAGTQACRAQVGVPLISRAIHLRKNARLRLVNI